MILAIGEILVDVFPHYERIGGAPYNFAFHLKNLGVPVHFVTRIGSDALGRRLSHELRQHGFDPALVQPDKEHPSGQVKVTLDANGSPIFDILPDVAYDYIELTPEAASILQQPPRLLYFGTLIQRSAQGFDRLQHLLDHKHHATKCLYDINLRPRCYTKTAVLKSLKRADVVKLSDEELEVLKHMLGGSADTAAFVADLMHTFDVEMVALTKGKNGSELFTPASRRAFAPPELPAVADTVGAGDGYAAMLAIGYLHGWRPEQILAAATAFAARICTIEGAVPASASFYDEFRPIVQGVPHAQR